MWPLPPEQSPPQHCRSSPESPNRRVSYSQDAHLFHVVVSNGIVYLCMADDVRAAEPSGAAGGETSLVSFRSTAPGLSAKCFSACVPPAQGFGRRVPFAFLEEIKHRFVSAYGTAATSVCSSPTGRPLPHTAPHLPPPPLPPSLKPTQPTHPHHPSEQALAYAYNTEFSRVLHQQIEYFSSNPSADAITRVKGDISEVKSVMVENIDKARVSAWMHMHACCCFCGARRWAWLGRA